MSRRIFRLFTTVLCLVSLSVALDAGKTNAAFNPVYLRDESTLPVIMYHRVRAPDTIAGSGDVDEAVFRRQMDWLYRNGYKTLTLAELEQRLQSCPSRLKQQNKEVVLTFDDGYDDFYTIVYPLLQHYDFHASVFPVVRAVGDPADYVSSYRHLTWDQLREMDRSGYVEVGSHTLTHPRLATLDEGSVHHQLKESKRILEQELGHEIRYLVYPYGSRTSRVQQIAAEYYSLAFNTKKSNIDCSFSGQPLDLNRQGATNESYLDLGTGGSSQYIPYVPDPTVSAAKIKLTMARILNGSGHGRITRREKISFFDWLERDNYFWKSSAERQAVRQRLLSQSTRFSDGTPWAYVMGDGEAEAAGNLGVFTNDQGAPAVSYEQSVRTYKQITARHGSNSMLTERIRTWIERAFTAQAAPTVTSALKTVTVEPGTTIIGDQAVNLAQLYQFSSLSLEDQGEVSDALATAVATFDGGRIDGLNQIRVANSPASFADAEDDTAFLPYIVTADGQLFFNEKLFLLDSSGAEVQELIWQGLSAWLDR